MDNTTYKQFLFRFITREFPDNLISATPVKLFGLFIGWKAKMAKPDYQWSSEN